MCKRLPKSTKCPAVQSPSIAIWSMSFLAPSQRFMPLMRSMMSLTNLSPHARPPDPGSFTDAQTCKLELRKFREIHAAKTKKYSFKHIDKIAEMFKTNNGITSHLRTLQAFPRTTDFIWTLRAKYTHLQKQNTFLRAGAKYIYVQAIATLPGAEKTTQKQYATTKHCVVSTSETFKVSIWSGHSEAVSVQMLWVLTSAGFNCTTGAESRQIAFRLSDIFHVQASQVMPAWCRHCEASFNDHHN